MRPALLVLVFLSALAFAPAHARDINIPRYDISAEKTLQRSEAFLLSLLTGTDEAHFRDLLSRAEALVITPKIDGISIGMTGEIGPALFFWKKDGLWRQPQFLLMRRTGFGPRLGWHKSASLIIWTDKDKAYDFVRNRNMGTIAESWDGNYRNYTLHDGKYGDTGIYVLRKEQENSFVVGASIGISQVETDKEMMQEFYGSAVPEWAWHKAFDRMLGDEQRLEFFTKILTARSPE